MPKKCLIDLCEANVFTHGYCKNHSYLYYGSKIDSKLTSKRKTIKPISDKRKRQLSEYSAIKLNKKLKMIASKSWQCFFTGKPFPKDYEPDWHHLDGRRGMINSEPLLTYEPYIVPCFHEPHMQWHDLPLHKLVELDWWEVFVQKMALLYPEIYNKRTLNKQL